MAEEKRVPNLLLYVVFQQVRDLMGDNSLAMLLRQGGLSEYIGSPPPADESPSITIPAYSAILADIYELFGPRGARPIFLQGGRQGGQEIRRLHAARYAVAGAALKLLSQNKRIELILEKVVEEGLELYGNPHRMREDEEAFYVEIEVCPYCAEIARRVQSGRVSAAHPVCHIPSAVYQEMIEWGTGNRHAVQEISCIALGAPACVFKIVK